MSNETVLTNAKLVLEDSVTNGTIVIRDGKILRIDEGRSAFGEDLEGEYILPGLIELHTDHLEAHYVPRPGVRWNSIAAVQAHDAQVAASGITTVFNCLRLGSDEDDGFEKEEMRAMADVIIQSQKEGRLRAEHFIHLRCEVSAHDVLDHFALYDNDGLVKLASLMDHAPGQRQFQTMTQYVLYYKEKRGLSDEAFDAFVKRRQAASAQFSGKHRTAIAQACKARGITIASHDDATVEHVGEARDFGVKLAEFPTSMEAAKESHRLGMNVLMGAPNIVRGSSHSGNISARELAKESVLDVLSSDYVPLSLIHAPFVLADEMEGITLSEAMGLVTSTPAKAVGLNDRGSIREGKRADLIRVWRERGVPVVRSVWREGKRVA